VNQNSIKDGRIVLDKSDVEQLSVPNTTIELLATRGLPVEAPLGVSFQDAAKGIKLMKNAKGEQLYVIGNDEGSTICLRSGDGNVVSVDESGEEMRKVNSELAHFLTLLEMYSAYAMKVQGCDDSEAESLAIQVANEMKQVDPPVFIDPDDWWPSVTQQMEFGML
jgi:hypothetical protein